MLTNPIGDHEKGPSHTKWNGPAPRRLLLWNQDGSRALIPQPANADALSGDQQL